MYIHFKRMLGVSNKGRVYSLERDIDGTWEGPTDGTGMLFDMEHMLHEAMRLCPEYGSIKITFEIFESKEDNGNEGSTGAEGDTE